MAALRLSKEAIHTLDIFRQPFMAAYSRIQGGNNIDPELGESCGLHIHTYKRKFCFSQRSLKGRNACTNN